MAFPQYSQMDLQSIPMLNFVPENVAGDLTASSTTVGRLYKNTSTGHIRYVLTTSSIVTLSIQGAIVDSDIASGAAIAMTKLATNPLARANHTGTQLAATISDFDAQVNTHTINNLTAPTADFSMNTHKITAVTDPSNPQEAATKNYVDNLVSSTFNGQDWKSSVRVGSPVNVTIATPGTTIDGVTMNNGDRVLLNNQTTASQNGIYVFNGSASAMTRATDAATSAQVTAGMTVPVTEGTTYADQIAILTTNDVITLGTTSLAFTFLVGATAYVGGTGITITGNSVALTVPVAVTSGGTGGITAVAARTSLNVPQKGFAADIGTLVAGTASSNINHALGTLDVIAQVYRKSDGVNVNITITRVDTNNVTVTSDIAVSTGILRIVIEPIA